MAIQQNSANRFQNERPAATIKGAYAGEAPTSGSTCMTSWGDVPLPVPPPRQFSLRALFGLTTLAAILFASINALGVESFIAGLASMCLSVPLIAVAITFAKFASRRPKIAAVMALIWMTAWIAVRLMN